MAIDPPSDIVLEVARAADPARAAAVAQRLEALGAGASASSAGADFSAALNEAGASATKSATTAVSGLGNARYALATGGQDKTAKAQQQFEAALLNNFVNEMLPKDAEQTYGKGYAGEMWRSLLAEKISNQLAASGALGIGKRLFATHPVTGPHALGHADATSVMTHAAAQTSANNLSAPIGADINNGAFLFAQTKAL